MRCIWALVFCVACSVDHTGLIGSDGGPAVDTTLGLDSTPGLDSGFDTGPVPFDGGPVPFDGGPDVSALDGGMPDVGVDAPPMIDAGPPDAGCTVGTEECDGNTRRECTNTGWVDRVCSFECRQSAGSATCFDLDPSNVDDPLSAIPPALLNDVIVTSGVFWNTDNCDDFENFWYEQNVPGEIGLCVLAYRNVTFQTSIRVVGSRALVVVATETITLDSIIRADAEGPEPGAGAPSGGVVASFTSPYSGDEGENESVSGFSFDSDGGGGGGGGFGEGGDGGDGASADGGSGGASFGTTYIPLRAGGAGRPGGGASRGVGGGGGGAVQFSARGDIFVRTGINVSGGRGQGGEASSDSGGGGGGGAGGTVVFESAGTVHFVDAEVLAAGGGGGGGGGCIDGENGEEEEEDSRTRGGDRGTGCSVRYTTDGGDGASDGPGQNADDFWRSGSNGGGGGGGSGLVVIRANAETGILSGSGHRVRAAPMIIAID